MAAFDILEALHDDTIPLDVVAERIPGMLHVNRLSDFRPIYIDPRSLKGLGFTSLEDGFEVLMGTDYVHPDDLAHASKITRHYLENTDDYRSISFTQRVFQPHKKVYAAFYTTSMLIEKRGGLVSFSVPLGDTSLNQRSIDRLIEEINFIRKNANRFSKLAKRELELFKWWVKDPDNESIADKMGLSVHTVKSYKKKIYKKLKINQFHELYQFARAFDFV